MEVTQPDINRVDSVIREYEDEPGSLISILQKVQDLFGYLPLPVLRYVAQRTGIKLAKVYGVASFYKQFRLTPRGKYELLLCQGTACHVNGSERLAEALREELQIEDGETTGDGLFTLSSAACLGCCSLAPVMMINGRAYGQLTPQKARRIVRELAEREKNSLEGGECR
ncbi:NADH:quinone oxidoreductase 24 kDa subunit E [Thermacetogenium phaeum DSM 12270]|jgi:NADH-quinone oxidoreductase subunit E|uniref:NADH:quinone oxidoreductase 24 kDa subunit E n=2 Tax=Thermacetogenium phaeum TaxID=85874 RepID=K4LSH4_THEPS|nr:NADH-quinone oxidoreductase subunit NuoE [Thermacetogenium phaeum]MDK2881185.1 NADH-quinone oxidoreductase subunit [Clostridia bacterium]MDN5365349.1 NADH-quinone oxidoreductase subunit [Thermacetogenium sp.]AFV11034.1 NADH:quinone oxidoreductase 24 kDa subunit E [Thermacetogenium phaeum DSM 12270]KUK36398.1 MAG: NADH:quinone oxidoreductase 24 kDa subunit E [Thermacetogenium phaeum]MDN5376477.1 NADH-quinone oxidoreductase subunit [Thermacetogenium sp.]